MVKTSTSSEVNRTCSAPDTAVTGVWKVPSGVLSVKPAAARISAWRPRATNTVGIPARVSTAAHGAADGTGTDDHVSVVVYSPDDLSSNAIGRDYVCEPGVLTPGVHTR